MPPLPVEWRESLNTLAFTADEPFNLHNKIKLNFNGKNVLMETVVSKTLYRELRNRVITLDTDCPTEFQYPLFLLVMF